VHVQQLNWRLTLALVGQIFGHTAIRPGGAIDSTLEDLYSSGMTTLWDGDIMLAMQRTVVQAADGVTFQPDPAMQYQLEVEVSVNQGRSVYTVVVTSMIDEVWIVAIYTKA
jgi:hypothetical protein